MYDVKVESIPSIPTEDYPWVRTGIVLLLTLPLGLAVVSFFVRKPEPPQPIEVKTSFSAVTDELYQEALAESVPLLREALVSYDLYPALTVSDLVRHLHFEVRDERSQLRFYQEAGEDRYVTKQVASAFIMQIAGVCMAKQRDPDSEHCVANQFWALGMSLGRRSDTKAKAPSPFVVVPPSNSDSR